MGLVSSEAFFVLAAEAEGGMRYLGGPIALVGELRDALRFLTPELAQARLGTASGLAAGLDWRVVRASAEIRLEPPCPAGGAAVRAAEAATARAAARP